MPTIGLTAPPYHASALAVGLAEVLSDCVLIQIAYPGTPSYISIIPSVNDPRSGDYFYGSSFSQIANVAAVQLAHSNGLPVSSCNSWAGSAQKLNSWQVNRKRVHRIWKSEGLGLPQRRPRRRRMRPVGEIINKAEYPNHVWSYDFVEDRTERGGKLRVLAIIDEFTRECLAIRVASSIPALVVIEALEWLFLTEGVPKYLRSDNGPEFVAKAVCNWLAESGCRTLFITPGGPWENGYIESFNDKLRDECLNREVFRNGKEAQTIVEAWRQEYNNHRPHSSLGYLTPTEFARRYYEKNQAKEVKQPVEKAGSLSL